MLTFKHANKWRQKKLSRKTFRYFWNYLFTISRGKVDAHFFTYIQWIKCLAHYNDFHDCNNNPLWRPSHTTHKTAKNAVTFHKRCNFFSQLQRFYIQLFYIWQTIFTTIVLEKSLQFRAQCVRTLRSVYYFIFICWLLTHLNKKSQPWETCVFSTIQSNQAQFISPLINGLCSSASINTILWCCFCYYSWA